MSAEFVSIQPKHINIWYYIKDNLSFYENP